MSCSPTGDASDTAFTGDWDGDGVDGIGVRRTDPAPPGPVVRPGHQEPQVTSRNTELMT